MSPPSAPRTPEPQPPPQRKPRQKARSVARLAAVQALYQMELGGTGAEAVIREFTDHRFERDLPSAWGGEGEGEWMAAADEAFFAEIVRGVVARQAEIDRAVVKRLATGWRLERLDATVRALLRCGAYELIATPELASEIVIDEYVELAKAFFDGAEPGFVNGALDGVARDVRD